MKQDLCLSRELRGRLTSIKHIALDMDGTLYTGNTLFPFTLRFLEETKKAGIGYSFLTNNPSKSRKDYLLHLKEMGITASAHEIYTSGQATIDYLKHHHPEVKRLFILGTPSMIKEFEEEGYLSTTDDPSDQPEAVVVAFDMSLTYARLCRAAWWISKGLPYIATNPDKICPTDQPIVLVDCGSLCSCLEDATGRAPDVTIGKPAPRMLQGLMQQHDLQPDEIAMVGDRMYTDIAMAKETNAFGVLVLTGETQEEDLMHSDIQPDIVVENIGQFGELLIKEKAFKR